MSGNESFAAIIPARYASTRFAGKPFAVINGKPMIQRVYEQAQKVFAHVYVATDDERIYNAVENFGGQCVMTKSTHQSGTDRCAQAIEIIEQELQQTFDVVVNVQGDEPFIAIEQMRQIQACFAAPQVQIATLAAPFGDEDIFSPNHVKVIVDNHDFAMYFSRSPMPYIRNEEQKNWHKRYQFLKHVGLYAYRCNVLREITALPQSSLETAENLEQLRWLQNGYKIKVGITHAKTYSVDTPEDLARILKLFRDE